MGAVKEEARKVIDSLPDDVSWEDIMYEMYVKKKIHEGIKAAEEGKTISHEKVKDIFIKNEDNMD